MADDSQQQAPDRGQRSVPRLLVCAGTALAGFTVAWILGTGFAAATTEQPDESALSESVRQVRCLVNSDGEESASDDATAFEQALASDLASDEATAKAPSKTCARTRGDDAADPTSIPKSLLDTGGRDADDPTASADGGTPADQSRGHHFVRETLKPVTAGVDRVAERAEPVVRPVGRAAGAVVSGVTGRRPLPEAVDSGVGALNDSLHGITGTGQPNAPEPSPAPAPGANDHVHGEPPMSPNAEPKEPAPAITAGDLESSGTLGYEHVDAFDHGPLPFTVDEHQHPQRTSPPFAPGSCNCGGEATTPGTGSHAGVGLGATAPAGHRDTASNGVVSRARTHAVADTSGPQPGTTPD